jgi:hypothetical protein
MAYLHDFKLEEVAAWKTKKSSMLCNLKS